MDSPLKGSREVKVYQMGGGRVSWLRTSTHRPGRGITSPGPVYLVQRTGTCRTGWVIVFVIWGLVFFCVISSSAMGHSSPDKIGQLGGIVEVCNAMPPLKGVVRNPKVPQPQSISLPCKKVVVMIEVIVHILPRDLDHLAKP